MSKPKTKNAQVGHSWTILLGMMVLPVLALMYKLFPHLETVWAVCAVLAVALVVRSGIGYVFPASSSKKSGQAATQAH